MTFKPPVLVLGLVGAVLIAAGAYAAEQGSPILPQWSETTLRLAAELPIQDGGRLKPLDTYARFTLLKLNGSRVYRGSDGDKRTAIAWLLDCLFFPELARQYKVFRVDNSDALIAMGLEPEKKRGRYSYIELQAGYEKLFTLAAQYSNIPREQQSAAQTQLINLAHNVNEFEQLTAQMDFARKTFRQDELAALSGILPEQARYKVSDILGKAPMLLERFVALREEEGASEKGEELQAIVGLVREVHSFGMHAGNMAMLPPANSESDHWLSPVEAIELAFASEAPIPDHIALLKNLEALAAFRDDPARFETELAAFHGDVTSAAEMHGHYDKIALEAAYYRVDLPYIALCLYILSFLLVAVTWMKPKSRFFAWAGGLAVLIPTLLLIAAITLRCIIRSRPPVTTLYETILFVTAVVAVVSLVVEAMYRQKVGLTLGSLLGALGLFLAYKYEAQEGVDTMPSMAAVLNTNFWLATHVTTITIGYAAGLLAGAIAHIYVLGRLFGLKKSKPAFYSQLGAMIYGVFGFALIFSIVGTVLGGIWANESWGRFWGWDPKENGALMIVLWQLAVLHARGGGYIREFGLALAAIFGGVIVAFSWFGVNLLGVGLHSYGFTSGVSRALMVFYIIETIVLFLGSAVWVWEDGLRMGGAEDEVPGEPERPNTTAGIRPSEAK